MEDNLRPDNTVNTCCEIPVFPFTGQTVMEAAAVHVAAARQGVLGWIRIFRPRAYLKLLISRKFECDWVTKPILRRFRQIEDELAFGIRGSVVDRRNLSLAVDVLQENLDTRHGLVSFILLLQK